MYCIVGMCVVYGFRGAMPILSHSCEIGEAKLVAKESLPRGNLYINTLYCRVHVSIRDEVY